MEVNISYTEFLTKLLNSEENLNINEYQEELIVNLYLTLLSLSNQDFSEDIDRKEKEQIDDFLRKLNNLKVKIQLKRKPAETNKLADDLITQYYENINVLSIYIKDGIELENVISTMDAKSITNLIDKVTKDKMNKEYSKEERNKRREEIVKLLPESNYYISNNTIYIQNDEKYDEILTKDFIEMFSYLLNPDNYTKPYSNKSNQRNHDLIIANIIKLLIIKDKKKEDIEKIFIPITLTHMLSLNIDDIDNLDTSNFNVENIKITELYSLASNTQNIKETNEKTPKWRNISIPNDYLIDKLKEMIKKGMYYYKEDSFVLENIENKTSDFKVSIKVEKINDFIKNVLETHHEKNKNNSKKNK